MTIMQLRYFLEVCRHQNVTHAAKELHVSQPSVSNAIRDLEEEFGVSLFHRVKMRLSLTREGEHFRERGEALLRDFDALFADMKDLGSKRNKIRIGVPPMIGSFLFPSIFSGFHEAYPGIELEIVEHGSRKIREMVLAEDLDIAIAVAEPKEALPYQTLPLLSTRLLFTVSPGHPMAGRESVRLEELDGQPLILFQQDSHQTELLKARFAALGVRPKIVLASSQLYTIRKMIAGGRAGTFLFREVLAHEDELVGIPLAEPMEMEICLIWKQGRQLFSDTAKLIRFVRQLYRH